MATTRMATTGTGVPTPTENTHAPRLPLPFAGAALLLLWSWHYVTDPRRPGTPALADGWWAFSDQGRYLADALAWAAFRLQPDQHWYLPGYGLLAAPFVHLTRADPFLLPDMALTLACLWLTAAVAAEMLPAWRWARALGAAAFLGSVAVPQALAAWTTPWTTTPAAALWLAGLLALLRLLRPAGPLPGAWRLAGLAGLCVGALASVRPADAALLGVVAGLVVVLAARPLLRPAAALAAGVAAPALLTLALYTAVHGWHLSPYLAYSAELGFEPRLLPLQWVTLVLDPRPMLPDGIGLIAVFPFIATGLAGMAACLVQPPAAGTRRAHLLLGGTAAAYGALYLCYRDLHPQGLWRFYNYHYFKWLLPVLALYTGLLATRLGRPAALSASGALLAALLPWRAELQPLPDALPPQEAGRRLDLPDGLDIRTGLIAAASGTFDTIYNGANNFYFGPNGEKWYGASGSIAAYPLYGGLLLAPLRPLLAGPGWVTLDPAVALQPGFAPIKVRFALRYGWPCWLPFATSVCHSAGLILPAPRPPGDLPFDGGIDPLLLAGWSSGGSGDRWTDGPRAGLRLRLRPAPDGDTVVTTQAAAFLPPGSPPLQVSVEANGRPVAVWVLADAASHRWAFVLPAAAFGPDGLLVLDYRIANPRRPSDWTGSLDTRLLGLRVQDISIQPANSPQEDKRAEDHSHP